MGYIKHRKDVAKSRIIFGIIFIVLGVIFAFSPLGMLEGGMFSSATKVLFGTMGIILGILFIVMGAMVYLEVKMLMSTNEDFLEKRNEVDTVEKERE